tara:strand:- start:813 stop:1040 length:228 start_codon:yes stop_codon:yes gene_type:complete
MSTFTIGSVVVHKSKPEFGYGIVVQNFSDVLVTEQTGECIAMILWHGDEDKEIVEMPQLHSFSELKILNTIVGFA